MIKIFKHTLFDLVRSRWIISYFMFFLVISFTLFSFSNDISMVIISLMNMILVLVPLIAIIFGITFYYNSREFTELLLSMPIKRTNIFLGQYLGLSISLSLASIVGVLIPFIFYGLLRSNEVIDFLVLMVSGLFLNFIFVALAFIIALINNNKIKGFGIATLSWLFLAIIYDGVFLLSLVLFSEYPLEKPAIALTLLNPIDLSRILILLKLDISALMGYTGAIFNKFFGHWTGILISTMSLILWTVIPILIITKISSKKDF